MIGRAKVTVSGKILAADPAVEIQPHMVEVNGHTFLSMHCNGLNVGSIAVGTGPEQITITLLRAPREGASLGLGLLHTMDPDVARQIAALLLQMAQNQEAGARLAANAALRKAAGK